MRLLIKVIFLLFPLYRNIYINHIISGHKIYIPVIVTPPVENILSVALGLYNLYVTPGWSSGS